MKILLFIDNLGSGGAQRQLVGLAVMLKQYGNDVKVCTYYPHDFYKSYLDENHVANEIIPGADNARKRILAVRSYFKKERPDWVIAYQETPSLVACAARALGCKYKLIVSERNTTQGVGIKERVRFLLYHVADSIIPNSYTQEKFLIGNHPWMKSKVTTITNFVDLDKFSFYPKERNKVPLIVVAATLFESKNCLGFLEAVRLLKEKGARFRVEWYGKVPDYSIYINKCQGLIEEYQIKDYIQLLDKTKEIYKKYQECDYFCLPSFFEGTPNVVCEAMSVGRPIICSNVCDNPFYVTENANGFLFDPKDSTQIASSIERALSLSEEEYESFCKKSREVAESKMSEDAFIKKYLNILN